MDIYSHPNGLAIVTFCGVRMTKETANDLRRADKRPPANTKEGQKYDQQRAIHYCQAVTGKKAFSVVWEILDGEKHRRVKAVVTDDGLWPVPNWDWNGHNATLEEVKL